MISYQIITAEIIISSSVFRNSYCYIKKISKYKLSVAYQLPLEILSLLHQLKKRNTRTNVALSRYLLISKAFGFNKEVNGSTPLGHPLGIVYPISFLNTKVVRSGNNPHFNPEVHVICRRDWRISGNIFN